MLSRFVVLSVSLILKASPFQGGGSGTDIALVTESRTWWFKCESQLEAEAWEQQFRRIAASAVEGTKEDDYQFGDFTGSLLAAGRQDREAETGRRQGYQVRAPFPCPIPCSFSRATGLSAGQFGDLTRGLFKKDYLGLRK